MAQTKKKSPTLKFPITERQLLIIAIGVGVVMLGYILMYMAGSTSWDNPIAKDVAPVILLIGYCVIIPYAFLYREKVGGQ